MKIYFITIKPFEEIENKLLYLRNFNVDPIVVYGKNHEKEDKDLYIDEYYKSIGPTGAIGCALSHIKTWNKFVYNDNDNNEDEYAMILEDDILFENNFNDKLSKVLKELKELKELNNDINSFDILYLGYIGGEYNESNIFKIIGKMLGISRQEKKITDNIVIPSVSLAMHGYIISKVGAKRLIEKIKKNKINHHIDYYLHSQKDLKCIACHPRIAFQTSTDTMKSENIKSSHPSLLAYLLNNVYVDKMVRANYLTCVSFAKLGIFDVNIISIFFFLIGCILSFSIKEIDIKVIKKISIFYFILSIPDLYNLNYLPVIFNYILFIIPLIIRFIYKNKK